MKLSNGTRALLVSPILLVGLSIHPSKAAACAPLGCFLGNMQEAENVLVLATVTELNEDTMRVVPEHIYSRTQFSHWFKTSFLVKLQTGTLRRDIQPKVGTTYFISLNCTDSVCSNQWGAWEVNGTDFRTARLAQIRYSDDAGVQWFMNGNGTDLYGIEGKMFARTSRGDIEIYPQYPLTTNAEEVKKEVFIDIIRASRTPIIVALLVVGCAIFFRSVAII